MVVAAHISIVKVMFGECIVSSSLKVPPFSRDKMKILKYQQAYKVELVHYILFDG